jgi:hypothetical protein
MRAPAPPRDGRGPQPASRAGLMWAFISSALTSKTGTLPGRARPRGWGGLVTRGLSAGGSDRGMSLEGARTVAAVVLCAHDGTRTGGPRVVRGAPCLRGNPAGDPHRRDRSASSLARRPLVRRPERERGAYPVAYVLAGFTGRGRALLNDKPWSPPLPERMDALIARGACERDDPGAARRFHALRRLAVPQLERHRALRGPPRPGAGAARGSRPTARCPAVRTAA